MVGLTGPRSLAALGWWSLIAGFGAVAALTRPSMRRLGVLVIVGLGATAIESYIGHAADPMEIGRHLVGPICRFTLLVLLGAVLAIEYLATFRSARAAGATKPSGVDGETEPPAPVSALESGDVATGSAHLDSAAVSRLSMSGRVRERGRRLWMVARSGRFWSSIAAGGLTVLITTFVLAAVFGNEFRSRNFDPLYMRVLVDRALRFGGSYYENGIHNKGPLEPFVYEVAARIGGPDGSWLVLSIVIVLASGGVIAAAALSARAAGATGAVVIAVALGTAYHFLLSRADYAGSLYARQITMTLLASAWAVALIDRCWLTRRRSLASSALIGLLAGLAVQTLLSSLFAAVVVAVTAILIRGRHSSTAKARWVAAVILGSAAAAVVVAPLWYLLRGSYQEFWSGWWTYARYSSTATGRGMRGQLVLGWDQAYDYYQRFPLSFVVIAALVATTLLLWRDYSYRVRMLRIGTIGWVGAAWLELAVSQRYSSHYYSILAVPTWIAFALLAADAERSLRERGHQLRRVAAVPVVATICFVFVGGATPLMDGVARASHFTSIGQLTNSVQSRHRPRRGGGARPCQSRPTTPCWRGRTSRGPTSTGTASGRRGSSGSRSFSGRCIWLTAVRSTFSRTPGSGSRGSRGSPAACLLPGARPGP